MTAKTLEEIITRLPPAQRQEVAAFAATLIEEETVLRKVRRARPRAKSVRTRSKTPA